MRTHSRTGLLCVATFGLVLASGLGTDLHGGPEAEKHRTAVTQTATFAGGCFWCMEPPFEKLDGVIEVTPGYTGGEEEGPTYAQVSSGRTGHAEAVMIRFDPSKISYRRLLDVYWRQIDPTDAGGQFADRGRQYRTAIFYHDEVQRRLAETSKAELARSGRFDRPITTPVVAAGPFYAAETYHQDFYAKQPERYQRYRKGSGRAGYLERTWASEGDAMRPAYRRPSEDELRKRLTSLQYRVVRENATERPFQNEYWDNARPGIYVDIASGEPLFASLDKFESRTGWPSFTRPLEPDHVVERRDASHGMERTEVRSAHGDSHLGHVFSDGPEPTGLRYCINSAALRFIRKDEMERAGYGAYLHLFHE